MISSHHTALAVATTATVIVLITWLRPGSKRGGRLPGPPGRLVVGNLPDLPQPGESDCVVYGTLCDKYGVSGLVSSIATLVVEHHGSL